MEGSSNCDTGCEGESVAIIPNIQKTLNIDLSSSSTVSMKEGCESPLSSWDSEPEADIMDDGFSGEMDDKSYDELLKKFIEKEEELRVSNLKFQLSDQENIKLKIQNLNSEHQLDNVRRKLNLNKDKLDNVRKQLALKEKELSEQKEISEEEAFKLMNLIKECKNQLDNVQGELNLKKEELQKQRVELGTHIEEEKKNVATLKRELEALVRINEENATNHHEELKKMVSILFDLQAKKRNLDSHFESLSNENKQLTSRLEACGSRNQKLEQKVMQYEDENLKQKKLHSTQVTQCEAENLKQKKLHSTQLILLQDEINVKIDKLKADISSCDNQLSQRKKNTSRKELVVVNEENKLKLKVKELEKVVSNQNDVILDMAKERIKQRGMLSLSFQPSLKHSFFYWLKNTWVSRFGKRSHIK